MHIRWGRVCAGVVLATGVASAAPRLPLLTTYRLVSDGTSCGPLNDPFVRKAFWGWPESVPAALQRRATRGYVCDVQAEGCIGTTVGELFDRAGNSVATITGRYWLGCRKVLVQPRHGAALPGRWLCYDDAAGWTAPAVADIPDDVITSRTCAACHQKAGQ